ncbi:hypothetical protein M0802_013885 [Mischocyttarus mexicanus]|nr:hypothetical protein M0802_013885 [Mischocyttarus mexicanus]
MAKCNKCSQSLRQLILRYITHLSCFVNSHISTVFKKFTVHDKQKNGTGEFYFDDLSDCPDSYSGSDSGDENDGSDIIIRKRSSVLPITYSDSEDEISNIEDDTNNIEDGDDIWSTEDEAIILKPFEGSPGIKIMPSFIENVMDSVSLFIGIGFFEHLQGDR